MFSQALLSFIRLFFAKDGKKRFLTKSLKKLEVMFFSFANRKLTFFQNEITSFRENETSERAAWERECRQRLDDEWKAKESGSAFYRF
jgi:hypothetical protein